MKARNLVTLFPTVVVSAALLACSSPDATSPVARVPHASLVTLASIPVPDLQSAAVVGKSNGFSLVSITFNDTADNEALVSAQFTAADGSVMTQGVSGVPGTGPRTVEMYGPGNVATVRLNYMFKDPSYPTTCGCLFGSYSATVTVAGGSTGTQIGKAKGHR